VAVWSVKRKARRLGGRTENSKKDRAGRIKGEGWSEYRGEDRRKTERVQFGWWLTDQFSAALEASQQCMI